MFVLMYEFNNKHFKQFTSRTGNKGKNYNIRFI
jgi:hypothetical protein